MSDAISVRFKRTPARSPTTEEVRVDACVEPWGSRTDDTEIDVFVVSVLDLEDILFPIMDDDS